MSLLSSMSFIISLFGSVFIFLIAYKLFNYWLKVREESLIHLALLSAYLGLLLLTINVVLILNIPFTPKTSQLSLLGIFYSIFYLELSFFYLTLFSNRRNLLEKYFLVIISTAIITSAILAVLDIEELIHVNFILQTLNIILGLYFVFQLYLRLKSSKQFFTGEALSFIELAEIYSLFAWIFLIFDGIGFLGMWIISIELSELFYFFIAVFIIVLSLGMAYMADQLRIKSKNCEITEIINILS
ncbi:MAG: hypothetical protein ACFFCQ_02430 [Promethearchaeota archaeon]